MSRDLLARRRSEPAEFEMDEGRWKLADGARARFALELPQGGRLSITGASEGSGRLDLVFEDCARDTGRVLARDERVLQTRGGRLGSAVELDEPSGALFVDLAWFSGDGSALVRNRLELAEPARERVPIILFSVDTLAARHTSLHGYARATTPHLEELARESVVFERCLANAPFTWPSYASQFTGLLP